MVDNPSNQISIRRGKLYVQYSGMYRVDVSGSVTLLDFSPLVYCPSRKSVKLGVKKTTMVLAHSCASMTSSGSSVLAFFCEMWSIYFFNLSNLVRLWFKYGASAFTSKCVAGSFPGMLGRHLPGSLWTTMLPQNKIARCSIFQMMVTPNQWGKSCSLF